MNGKQRLERAIENVNNAVAELERTRELVEAAATKTAEVLAIAEQLGVKTVSIGVKTPLVGNDSFPFGGGSSLFTPKGSKVDGWPSAWRIAEQAGISTGCGNSGQHQIMHDSTIDGVYRCINGQWERVKKYDE